MQMLTTMMCIVGAREPPGGWVPHWAARRGLTGPGVCAVQPGPARAAGEQVRPGCGRNCRSAAASRTHARTQHACTHACTNACMQSMQTCVDECVDGCVVGNGVMVCHMPLPLQCGTPRRHPCSKRRTHNLAHIISRHPGSQLQHPGHIIFIIAAHHSTADYDPPHHSLPPWTANVPLGQPPSYTLDTPTCHGTLSNSRTLAPRLLRYYGVTIIHLTDEMMKLGPLTVMCVTHAVP